MARAYNKVPLVGPDGEPIGRKEYNKIMPNNRSAAHLNGDLLCAIDTETTGLVAGVNDIVQLAIVPLNSDFDVLNEWRGEKITPFSVTIKPARPENWDPKAAEITGLQLKEIMEVGVDVFQACEMFEKWFAKFDLGLRKRIVPLAMNYQFDKGFIQDLLGGVGPYETFFHHQYRDLFQAALYINDNMYTIMSEVLFAQPNLKQICSVLEIPYEKGHNAMADACLTAQCYKAICRRPML